MTTTTPSEQFQHDVREHRMTVLRDDGVNRQIRFTRPDTTAQHFDLITWRGHLCFTGDMGTYVFRRLDDMFEFFRRTPADRHIDFAYWAEKCVSADKHDGIEQFSPELFRARFTELAQQYATDNELAEEDRAKLLERLDSEVFATLDEGDQAAYAAAREFQWQARGHMEDVFPDYWEVRAKEYTPRFDWCCRAIAWGIGMYDVAKQKAA